jgi:hypothetical protein
MEGACHSHCPGFRPLDALGRTRWQGRSPRVPHAGQHSLTRIGRAQEPGKCLPPGCRLFLHYRIAGGLARCRGNRISLDGASNAAGVEDGGNRVTAARPVATQIRNAPCRCRLKFAFVARSRVIEPIREAIASTISLTSRSKDPNRVVLVTMLARRLSARTSRSLSLASP